jgi:hypothetical protein
LIFVTCRRLVRYPSPSGNATTLRVPVIIVHRHAVLAGADGILTVHCHAVVIKRAPAVPWPNTAEVASLLALCADAEGAGDCAGALIRYPNAAGGPGRR